MKTAAERAAELARLQKAARDRQQGKASEAATLRQLQQEEQRNKKLTERKATILDGNNSDTAGGTSLLAGTASQTGNWRPQRKTPQSCNTCS